MPVLLLDDHKGVGQGSRAICFAKRALEIAALYGSGEAMREKGVVWNVGKVFFDDRKIYDFNLLPEGGDRFPAFINLQQHYFGTFLFEQIEAKVANGALIGIRGKQRVKGLTRHETHSTLDILTPGGPYGLDANWLIAGDGASSPLRDMMDLSFEGQVFEDSFLIADIRMAADFPTERWFWFEPHFKSGASALLHKQPDDIWRIDFQIGWDVDRTKELK